MKTLAVFNEENVTPEEAASYRVRSAVRAVVLDLNNNVAVIHATKPNFHEIPGGGVEDGESFEETVIRECKEEIGCDVVIEKEIGVITEYRKEENLTKNSYCYLARVQGEKGEINPMEDELELGMEIRWVSIDEAERLIQEYRKEPSYKAAFSIKRDVALLEEAKKLI